MSDPSESVTIDRESLRTCVRQAIEEVNEQLPPEQRVDSSPNAKLFGQGAPLDSLGLVNLIVAVEEALTDELDLEITLANEKAMSRRSSPFQSVDSLLDFVEELIQEADGE